MMVNVSPTPITHGDLDSTIATALEDSLEQIVNKTLMTASVLTAEMVSD